MIRSNGQFEMPVEDADTITVKADKQCLIDLSGRDTSDPNIHPTFAQIIGNPELYMDKLLTFEAVIKKLHKKIIYPPELVE